MVASSDCMKKAMAAIHGKPAMLRADLIIECPSGVILRQEAK